MRRTRRCPFYRGLQTGFLMGLAFLLAPLLLVGPARMSELLQPVGLQLSTIKLFTTTNLQGSVVPFVLVLVFFCWHLYRLHRELQFTRDDELESAPEPLDKISTRDQLLELSASLFFGIGVIWTAIGMREAMLNGLGNGAVSSDAGAFTMLQGLIEGGILIALSTTIVGSIGGYLMRVTKSLLIGPRLTRYYLQAGDAPLASNTATLRRIESLLQRPDQAREDQP